MSRIRKTVAADKDLLALWEYIAADSPAAADRFWQRLERRFQLLLMHPDMGQSQQEFLPGLRSIVEGPYVVFYVPKEDGIEIYRILHGARRWEELLRPIGDG